MYRHMNLTLALTLVLAPTLTSAGDSAPAADQSAVVKLQQVELTQQGTLVGRYLDETGQPSAGATVVVKTGDVSQKLVTDDQGRFVAQGLRGGRCVIQAGKDYYACQVWANGTAPPKSIGSVAIVKTGGPVVRGQLGLPALTTKQKVGLGILVAGGVAVAIAVSQDDDSLPAASP
ncbi:MAG: carboxypeptidase-like regulatory domain-containing protein [Planctomycetaceae bacterium]